MGDVIDPEERMLVAATGDARAGAGDWRDLRMSAALVAERRSPEPGDVPPGVLGRHFSGL